MIIRSNTFFLSKRDFVEHNGLLVEGHSHRGFWWGSKSLNDPPEYPESYVRRSIDFK